MATKNEEAAKAASGTETKAEKLAKTDAKIAAASGENMEASGAIIEPEAKARINVDEPSVDNNPRAGTSEAQNAIDFNLPGGKVADHAKVKLDGEADFRNEEDAKRKK